jgi:hypothetical protein
MYVKITVAKVVEVPDGTEVSKLTMDSNGNTLIFGVKNEYGEFEGLVNESERESSQFISAEEVGEEGESLGKPIFF